MDNLGLSDVYLDTDINSSCVDIFTVDTNAQNDLLGVYDVYLDTDTNSSCVDIFTVDNNARMYDLCLSDVYLDTYSNSSCFGIFTVSGFLGDLILQSKLSRQKIQIKALDPIHAT